MEIDEESVVHLAALMVHKLTFEQFLRFLSPPPGSPFNLDIVDSSNVTVSGDGLSLVSVNKTASFQIHGSGGSKIDVEVIGKSFFFLYVWLFFAGLNDIATAVSKTFCFSCLLMSVSVKIVCVEKLPVGYSL